MKASQKPFLSIVVPVYNEEDNVEPLYEKIRNVCKIMRKSFEVLFVDDGSNDNTFEVLSNLREIEPNLAVIRFQRNAGQTSAMAAGFEYAQGEIIISMDGDLQNDPADIPKLLEKLDDGFDLVCGWRKERHDKFWSRRVPSIIANWIIGIVTGVAIHDNGCSLKAYRSEMIKQVPLYGEMHRFIPAMSTVVGARISEIVVTHHPRQFGTSKYGLARVWKVFLDILAFKLLLSIFAQSTNPDRIDATQNSISQQNIKYNIYRISAFLSIPFLISGFFLFNTTNFIGICLMSIFASIIGIGIITGTTVAKAHREAADFSSIARFFIINCSRRPIRYFGPFSMLIVFLGCIVYVFIPSFAPIIISLGILGFYIGLFGEVISYTNAKKVNDYTVEIFLNSRNEVMGLDNNIQ